MIQGLDGPACQPHGSGPEGHGGRKIKLPHPIYRGSKYNRAPSTVRLASSSGGRSVPPYARSAEMKVLLFKVAAR
jgi:hypothetical protein